jgi:high affinity choline transporter 7
MRAAGHATLIDPLEDRYGPRLAAVLMVPAVLAELFWSAAILVALGSTFGTVIGLELAPSIVLSAAVAIAYTVFGGLRAVAWTDVVQLFLILGGLVLAIPYVVDAGGGWGNVTAAVPAMGFGTWQEGASWSDWTLLLVLGGIPWNVYFQRVLSSESPEAASRTSMLAAVLCASMAVPPMILGIAATHVDWSALDTGGVDAAAQLAESPTLVLPYLLRYAVPLWVGVLGLGAVSAAVMSSVDSSILSAASLVAWNGYRRLGNPDASAEQVGKLVRALVVVLGVSATVIALTYGSVSALWYLCGDIVYCVLFPQLTLALFDPKANRLGASSGLAASVVLRLLGGDGTLGLPNLVYPDWSDAGGEFPFRTLAMATGLVVALVVARATQSVDPPRPRR